MAGEYRLSERAAQDISDVYAYSLARWGEETANRYIEAIYLSLKKLADHPDRDVSRNKRGTPFRMAAVRQHFILYEVLNDEIVVLTIMHQAQNVEKHVAKLTPAFKDLIAQMMREG